MPKSSGFSIHRYENVQVFESADLNQTLRQLLSRRPIDAVLSIDNKTILVDDVLATPTQVYNVHNGLVQKYRGIAEVCVFAAVCRDETSYGTTAHRLLPRQQVDAGPVVLQESFEVSPEQDFSQVFGESIRTCERLTQRLILKIAEGAVPQGDYLHGPDVYQYRDLARVVQRSNPDRLARATQFGHFEGLLNRLVREVRAAIASQ